MGGTPSWSSKVTIAIATVVGLGLVVSPAIGGPSLKSLVKKEVAKQIKKATGPAGSQGLKGDPGPAGPVTGVLPSGVSETGAFVARDPHNPGSGAPIEATISFPLRLSTGVSAFYVLSGGPAIPQCAGSAANPTAAPGTLCAYEAVKANEGEPAQTDPYFVDPVTTLSTSITRPFGVILRATTAAGADAYIYGSWAVTAP